MITRLVCLPLLVMPALALAGNWSESTPEYPAQSSLDSNYLLHGISAQQAAAEQSRVMRSSLRLAKVAAFFISGHYAVSPVLSLTYRTEASDTDMVSKAEACSRLGVHLRF